MKMLMGRKELKMGSKYLTELRDSNDILENTKALRQRMQEDGYLLIRDFHNRSEVLEARMGIIRKIDKRGKIERRYPLKEAIIRGGNKGISFQGAVNDDDNDLKPFYQLVSNEEVMTFFHSISRW